jgi:hypothetical protein
LAKKTTVVTPQRFAQGYTFDSYMSSIKVNKERILSYYKDFKVKSADAKALQALAQRPKGPAKALVLAEDWCTDVVRGLPALARLAEVASLEMRVFPRDQNSDIMREFLKQGKYESIPTMVFYTKDLDYICHWIERPGLADKDIAAIEADIKREKPGLDEREFGIERRNRMSAYVPSWQQAVVEEVRDMLEKSVK